MPVDSKGRSLARSVVIGVGIIGVAGAVNRLFSLVSAPFLTRVLGPSPYGVVSLLSTVTALATTLSLLGIDSSYARFFFSDSGERREAVERFCWRFSLVSASVVASAAGVVWWILSPRAGLPPDFAIMAVAGVALSVLTGMGTTMRRLRGSYSRIALSIVASGGVGVLVSIAIAAYVRKDAWALVAGATCGLAAASAVLGLPSLRELMRDSGLSNRERWEILRLGLTGAYIAPVYWLMSSADRWFLAGWRGQEELGVYSFAGSLGMVGIMVNSAVTMAWFPEMIRVYEFSREKAPAELGRMWTRLVGGLLVVWLAVAAAGGDVLRLLADSRFHSGAVCIPWLAGGVFFYGVCSLANTGLLLRKDLKPVIGWWTAGAAVNVALNGLLVKTEGAVGAAVASCLAFALVAAGVMSSAQSRVRLDVHWGRLSVAGVFVLGAGIAMFPPWASTPLSSLAVKFPVGLACAAILLRLLAPDWFLRIARGKISGGGEAV